MRVNGGKKANDAGIYDCVQGLTSGVIRVLKCDDHWRENLG